MEIILFLSLMIPSTLFMGVYDVLARKILKTGINERVVLGITFCSSGALLFIVALAVGLPEIKPGFWMFFAITVSMNVFAQLFWLKAFAREEASLISPFRLISPPLMLVTGFLFLGEEPSLLGAVGIFITVIGMWFLLHEEALSEHKSLFKILKRPGVLFAIVGAISFAISLPLDKGAVVRSSAVFFAGIGFFSVGFINVLISIALKEWNHKTRLKLKKVKKEFPVFVIIHSIGIFLAMQALNYALAAYAGSVKRLTSLWTVLISGKFLHEKNIARKAFATVIMLAGIAVTLLLG
jgi:drug/metabolite transporter (DMT)-like permease